MLQKILSRMRKAIEDYHMIAEGDHIAVGVSGGKDSLVLLTGLVALQRFLPVRFRLTAITLSMGFEGFDRDALVAFYEKLGVAWHIEETRIGEVVFDIRKESNPCALCANMKRGTLHSTAKRLGCNKIAFGHHMDDAIETLMMSLIYEGRLHCFSPVTDLDRTGITLIRPMIYAEEKMIRAVCRKEGITPIPSGCPVDGGTKRESVKRHIVSLKAENPNIRAALFGAIQRGQLNGWKPMGKSSQYKKGHPGEEADMIRGAAHGSDSRIPVPEGDATVAAGDATVAPHDAADAEAITAALLHASVPPEHFHRLLAEQLPMAVTIVRESDAALLYMNRLAERDFRITLDEARNLPIGAGHISSEDIAYLRRRLKEEGVVRNAEIRLSNVDGHFFWGLVSAIRISMGAGVAADPVYLVCISRIDALKDMEERLARSHARQTLMLGMLLQLYHPADLGRSYTNVLGLTGRYLDIDRASLFTYQQDGRLRLRQEWKTLSRNPPSEDTLRLADHRSRLLQQLGAFMHKRNRHHTGLSEEGTDWAAETQVEIPPIRHPWFAQVIRLNDQPVALLLLEDYRPDRVWSEDDRATLDSVGFILTMTHDRRRTELHLQAASRKVQEANLTKSRFLANMSHELRTPLNAILGFMDLLGTTPVTEEQRDYIREAKTASDLLLFLVNDVLDYSKIEAGHLKLETIRFDLRDCVENTILLHAPKAREKGIRLGMHIDPALPETMLGDPLRIAQILGNLVSNAVKFTHEGNILVEVLPDRMPQGADPVQTVSSTGWRFASRQEETFVRPTDDATDDKASTPDASHPARITVLHSLAGDVFPYLSADEIPGQMQLPIPTAQLPNTELVSGTGLGLVIRISDSGIGMSRAVLNRLFKPFMQGDDSISRQYGGTGLGLTITHRLVEMMHGWIAVESHEGRGTSFTCHIPLSTPPADAPSTGEAGRMPAGRGDRVLIATANRMSARILARYLESAGYLTETACSVADATGRLDGSTGWHALFLADDLPDAPTTSLPELLEKLPASADIPLVALSQWIQGGTAADPRFRHRLHLPARYRDVVSAMRSLRQSGESASVPASGIGVPGDPDMPGFMTDPGGAALSGEEPPESLRRLPEKAVSQEEGKSTPTGARRGAPAILLVEDNPTNRVVFVNMLRIYGLSCDEARDGMEAVRMCESRHYDMLFMDCQMPVLDGFSATRLIRKGAINRNARIIALTAHTLAGDRSNCEQAGMDDYIGKPFTMDLLFSCLDKSLQQLGFPLPQAAGRPARQTAAPSADTGVAFPKPSTYEAKPVSGAELMAGGMARPTPAASDAYRSRWSPEHPVQEPINTLIRELGFARQEVEELVVLFVKELSETMTRSIDRRESDTPGDFARLFHRHRGAAGSLQLHRFHKLLEILEQAERDEDDAIRRITTEETVRLLDAYKPSP